MPFLLNCSSCGKEYNLPDSQKGKRVRCKDCGHTFTADPNASEETDNVEGIASSRTSGTERSGSSRSSRRDSDDDDAPRSRQSKPKRPIRKSDDSGYAIVYVLLGVGLFLLLTFGSCIFGIVHFVYSVKQAVDELVPTNTDQALANVRSENPLVRMTGIHYFANSQNVEESRRKEVADALEPLLSEQDDGTRANVVRALGKWGTRDNAPAVMKVLEQGKVGNSNESQKAAMEALGRWKYEPAEPGILNLMNDPNDQMAQHARKILEQDYHCPPDKFAAQCALDLKSGQTVRVKRAAEWLKDHPAMLAAVSAPRRKDVALALDPLPENPDREISASSINALKLWATIDNLTTFARLAEDDRPQHDQMRNWAIEMLGSLKDQRAAPILASLLVRSNTRPHAKKALLNLGSSAEPDVRKLLGDADKTVVIEACRVLETIGTNASLPDLEKVTKDTTDKQVTSAANQAINKIKSRGK